jgi:YjbR
MTAEQFRQLALNLDGATEGSHQGHPDFRAHGKIFATLHYPDDSWGMVKLSPPDQARLVEMQPAVFVPAKGVWGRQGCTSVRLTTAKSDLLKCALDLAWQNSGARNKKTKRVVSK